jgi:hypothetical protein
MYVCVCVVVCVCMLYVCYFLLISLSYFTPSLQVEMVGVFKEALYDNEVLVCFKVNICVILCVVCLLISFSYSTTAFLSHSPMPYNPIFLSSPR